jgi:hypothetical protein
LLIFRNRVEFLRYRTRNITTKYNIKTIFQTVLRLSALLLWISAALINRGRGYFNIFTSDFQAGNVIVWWNIMLGSYFHHKITISTWPT